MTIEEFNSMDAQRDARLESTRECINNLRLARSLEQSPEICTALFQLAESVAKIEWGPLTTVDDFSCPDHFIVSNGAKTKKL